MHEENKNIAGPWPAGGQCVNAWKILMADVLWRWKDGINIGGGTTVDVCKQQCKIRGFHFTGAQGRWCFCGNIQPPQSSIVSDASCDISCPGNGGQICGGGFKLSVYATGLAS